MDLELFFIVRKWCIDLVSFYHRVGLVSIIFHAKHFEQRFYSRYNGNLTHSVRKLAFKSQIS